MGKSKTPQGRIISIWIPKKHYWIFKIIRRLQLKAENQGLPLSMGDVLREIIFEALIKLKRPEDDG